jgi:hypothetical protein
VIKTWSERCEKHRDHQTGMVSHGMIQARMQEEIDELRAALAQPEQEPVGWLYESRAGVRIFHPASDDKRFQADWEAAQQHPEAHKMTPLYTQSPQHLQSFAQDWDAPGMEAYDDPPLAPPEPTRSQQMRDAGYTRRPRQLPGEDEQEPVAYQWLGTSVIRKRIPKTAEAGTWRPLYAVLPQRKPLTDEEIELAYREIWRNLSDGFSHTSAEWIEAGIRYAEKVHGIE